MDSADQRVALQALLFRNLPEELALGLVESAVVKEYSRGEAIFLQGDSADFIGVVLDGWVKLFRVKPNGAEAVIGVFTRGNSFGEAPAVMEGTFPVSAAAVTDCRLLLVRAAPLIELMARNPAVTRAILAATLAHMHGLVHQIEQLKAQSGAQRLAEFLAHAGRCRTLHADAALRQVAGRGASRDAAGEPVACPGAAAHARGQRAAEPGGDRGRGRSARVQRGGPRGFLEEGGMSGRLEGVLAAIDAANAADPAREDGEPAALWAAHVGGAGSRPAPRTT